MSPMFTWEMCTSCRYPTGWPQGPLQICISVISELWVFTLRFSGRKGRSKSSSIWLVENLQREKPWEIRIQKCCCWRNFNSFYCVWSLILVSWLERSEQTVQFSALIWAFWTPDKKWVDMRIWRCSDVSTCKEQNGKTRGTDFPATEEKSTGEHLLLWKSANNFNLHSNILSWWRGKNIYFRTCL